MLSVQLRALCAQHGVRKTGARAEVVLRLCDVVCAEGPAPPAVKQVED